MNYRLFKYPLIILICFIANPACHKSRLNQIDVAKVNQIKSILIIGNSIEECPPSPQIGWYGNWGMAASCKDSDFVHLLIEKVHRKDSLSMIKYLNLAEFERKFTTFDLSNLDGLIKPDVLIVKLSENVDNRMANISIICSRRIHPIKG